MEVIVFLIGLCVASAELSRDYGHIEAFIGQKKFSAKNKKYRPLFHITAPVGWLGHPAAFIYYKSHYHVFYQYHPYNGAWGAIHWGHVVSKNLIDWTHYPVALVPKDYYEKHGCLAGTAVVRNRYLTLFYTGHVMSNNRTRQTQNVAVSADSIMFQKYLYNPIIRDDPFGVGDFRNPKVWRYRDHWFMLIGTKTPSQLGQLVLYTSPDMFNWRFNRTIAESYGDMGHMWENPDTVYINGLDVLILSVQGIQPDGYRFRNLFQTGYVVGRFNYKKLVFEDMEVSTATFNELDHGHDFYAAKTMIAPDGRRLLIAWMGMWETDATEAKEGWACMLTLIRELRINRRGLLLMSPISEMMKLRTEILEAAWYVPGESFSAGRKHFELVVNATSVGRDVGLILEWDDGESFKIGYSADHRYVSIDRGGIDGVRRADWSPVGLIRWRIFIDASAAEVFCGDGEVVFTSRIYPRGPITITVGGQANVHITQYKLKKMLNRKVKLKNKLKNNLHH